MSKQTIAKVSGESACGCRCRADLGSVGRQPERTGIEPGPSWFGREPVNAQSWTRLSTNGDSDRGRQTIGRIASVKQACLRMPRHTWFCVEGK